ncbi:MAG: hypothetical protein IPK16_07425 [Anaerolineales bacterium]|nr:hypothetical protein [Anaerolineales bacterium]
MINAVCPVCGATVDARLLAHGRALQPAVAAHVRRLAPGWHPEYGICPACALAVMHTIAEQRSPVSLHTENDPATTFPYYHADEETVLGQAQRMPDYMTFPGTDVTIAFLDSGFYPHPDFSRTNTWSGASPAWHRLTESELSAALRAGVERLIEYVDLTDDGEHVGLDTPSLWDSAGDSWHGEMTTAIAAGNGLLSGGRFRG